MKITNYDIYKLRKAGLTNQQILTVLEYDETVDQELLLGEIAEISGCRNPAVFMERYFQIDDAQLEKEFQKFPSFSILDDCYPWDLSEIYDAPVLLFYKGNLDLLKFPKVAVVGSRSCSSQGAKSVQKIIQGLENELIVVSGLAKGIDTAAHMAALRMEEEQLLSLEQDWMFSIPEPINVCRNTLVITIWYLASTDLVRNP